MCLFDENKKLFESLPMSELLDILPDSFYIMDDTGTILYINDKFAEYTGLTKSEITGTILTSPIHPDDIQHLREKWLRHQDEKFKGLCRIKRHDGVYKMFKVMIIPVKTNNGDTLYVGQSFQLDDEDQYKWKLDVLFESILDLLPVAVLIIDKFFKIKYNKKLAELWPESVGESKALIDLIKAGTDEANLKLRDWPIFRSLQNGETVTDFVIESKNYFLLVNSAPVRNENGEIDFAISVAQDLTDYMKVVTERFEALNKASLAKQTNDMKNSFLANISHEIRTPLHGILGILCDVISNGELTPDIEKDLKKIKATAQNLVIISNNILDLTKLEAGKLPLFCENLSIADIINELHEQFAEALQNKNIDFDVELVDIPLEIKGDPKRLKQCLENIIMNSLKYTDIGGKILVTAKGVQQKSDNGSIPHCTIIFTISDTGIGMTKDTISKIFTSFTQADDSLSRDYGGVGIGLTVVQKLVHLMNNKTADECKECINVESEIGKGTKFSFKVDLSIDPEKCVYTSSRLRMGKPGQKLTLSSTSTSSTTSTTTTSSSSSSTYSDTFDPSKIHVLLVEDNELNRTVATRMLKKFGFKVTTAENGYEAIRLIEQNDVFDIMLLDIQMPVMDGDETAKELQKRHWGKPIIAQTANSIEAEKEKYELLGVCDYITKPFDVSSLLFKLRKALLDDKRPGR